LSNFLRQQLSKFVENVSEAQFKNKPNQLGCRAAGISNLSWPTAGEFGDACRRAAGSECYPNDIRAPPRPSIHASERVICFDSGGLIGDKPCMPKKPGTNPKGEFAFFNVFYEDGSQRSNRRVPAELLGGLDGDEPARAFIHEQDREIAEKSGRPPLEIKSISRVGAKKK
jgi:hypothetical protein